MACLRDTAALCWTRVMSRTPSPRPMTIPSPPTSPRMRCESVCVQTRQGGGWAFVQRECSAVFGASEGEKKVDGGKRKYTENTVCHARIAVEKKERRKLWKRFAIEIVLIPLSAKYGTFGSWKSISTFWEKLKSSFSFFLKYCSLFLRSLSSIDSDKGKLFLGGKN